MSRVFVFWSEGLETVPFRSATLNVTGQRLILVQPIISHYWILATPPFALLGLLLAGWSGPVVVVGLALLITIFSPRRVVAARSLTEVAGFRLLKLTGVARVLLREIVDIDFSNGDHWRLSTGGRSFASARPIVLALDAGGLSTSVLNGAN